MDRFYIISCDVLSKELRHFVNRSQNRFEFQFLEQGLHNTPDNLRKSLQKAIDGVEGDYSAILIGYGLCSNGLVGITARNTKLVIIRGHDCITFLLGSKTHYQQYFQRHPGTYWYSPGWIETTSMPGKQRYERTRQSYVEKYGEENADYLMEMEQAWFKNYSNAAYVDLVGSPDTESYKAYTQKCAQWLGWKYDEISGDPKLIENFLAGNWDAEGFWL